MPSVKRDLQATADLLDALQNDPKLLEDADFIHRLSILRQKHEETSNFLAKQLGAAPIPTSSGISRNSEGVTSSGHLRIPNRLQSCRRLQEIPEISVTSSESSQKTWQMASSESSRSTVREILNKATEKYKIPTKSVEFSESLKNPTPSGRLLTSSEVRRRPEFVTSSEIVEESFFSDGLSTTREVPTIVDEIVETSGNLAENPKKSGNFVEKTEKNRKNRSKSMQNVNFQEIPTIPKPFQLSLRKTIENTYSKRFMEEMLEEKKKKEAEISENLQKSSKFKAKPVPKSTYTPTNTFATEIKYVEAMRRKISAKAKKKFDEQNELVRSKSEGNLASVKPLGYVPASTYISPIPVKPNARSRSATTRSAILIQEATTPKGIKSHRHASNLTHELRHGKCKMDTSTVTQYRRVSPPDFQKIHEDYRKNKSKPTTIPIPFKFESRRTKSANSRHLNCGEKEVEQFKKKLILSIPNNPKKTLSTQLREELNRNKIKNERKNEEKSEEIWKEDNRRRIANFLGTRSKTEEDIAIRTRRKIQQQQETTQEYMKQLAQMKQRVLNGPLIMEKQSALAQEHRLKRKFEERMKKSTSSTAMVVVTSSGHQNLQNSSPQKTSTSSRRTSSAETSAAGTFVVETSKYEEDFENPSENSEISDEESEISEDSEDSTENSS